MGGQGLIGSARANQNGKGRRGRYLLQLLGVEGLLAVLAVVVEPVLGVVREAGQLVARGRLEVGRQVLVVVDAAADGQHELFERVLRVDAVALLPVLRLQLVLALRQQLQRRGLGAARPALHQQLHRLHQLGKIQQTHVR